MNENLVKIRVEDGEIRFSVSEAIRELAYEEMIELRETFCLAIAESEKLWKRGQQ